MRTQRLQGKIVGRCGNCDGYVVVPHDRGHFILQQDALRRASLSPFFQGMCTTCGGIAQGLPTFTTMCVRKDQRRPFPKTRKIARKRTTRR
jgi:hypothetical protein